MFFLFSLVWSKFVVSKNINQASAPAWPLEFPTKKGPSTKDTFVSDGLLEIVNRPLLLGFFKDICLAELSC